MSNAIQSLRDVASKAELRHLLRSGQIEDRHIDAPISVLFYSPGEDAYRVDDVVVFIRDAVEPIAVLAADYPF